jgi:Leucine-rich repeat (LRR) protein
VDADRDRESVVKNESDIKGKPSSLSSGNGFGNTITTIREPLGYLINLDLVHLVEVQTAGVK